MPASIKAIPATRTCSMKPAKGLRYGNFDGVRNLPPLNHNMIKKARSLGSINNEQICRRVCQWMESWQPWQTRTMLCGIANRFSVSQLEILSTTLEPLRHRDYKTSTLRRYPSASLKDKRSLSPIHKKSRTTGSENISFTMPSTVKDRDFYSPVVSELMKKEEKNKSPQDCLTSQITPNIDSGGQLSSLNQYSSNLAMSVLESALDEVNHVLIFDKVQFVNPCESSSEVKKDSSEPISIHENIKSSMSLTYEKNEEASNEELGSESETQECAKSLVFDKMSLQKSLKSAVNGHKTLPQSSRMSSARFLSGTLEFSTIDPYQKDIVRAKSTSSQYRYSTFGSSVVSTAGFFNKEKITILGSMQQSVQPNTNTTPVGADLAPISLQKYYKHSRWWPPQAPHGKIYRHPQRQELANNFKEQLHSIWEWLKDWEGYERISFVKEVLKICSAEILDSLMNHIHQRLKDARDINRLPDQLLLYILSFLPLHDVLRSAKVCRRWRYLCATDDLWILKCLEIGEEVGISNLPELIAETKLKGMRVDWMLAHFELSKLAASVGIEWTLDSVDRPPDRLLKYDRIWTGIIRPYAGELSMEKEKSEESLCDKKVKGKIHFNTGIKERLEQANRSCDRGAVDNELSDTDSAFSEEDLSQHMSEYNMMLFPSGSSGDPKWSKSLTKTDSFKLSIPEMIKEDISQRTSVTNRLTRSSKKSSAASKKMEEDNKDVALDIRTDLSQSCDILGKMKSYNSLEWETADTYNDYMRTTLYAGEVVGVKRMRKLQGHINGINCVHFDKRRLVTCGSDRVIRLWDVRSGRFLHEFRGHKGGIRCVQFDNDIMATGSWDCYVIVWDMKTFSKIETLQGHADSVTCLQFDGDLLITGSDDHTVRLWRRPNFFCMLSIQFDASVRSLIIVDHLFVVSTSDLTTEMIDVYTGTKRRKFERPLNVIQCLMAHGQLLMGGDEFGRVCFWNLSTGEMEAAVKAHDACVNQLNYHNGRFFTASSDTTIKEWDLRTMTCLRVLKGHRGPVRDVKVSDRRIVSCSDDSTVRIWDLVVDKTKVVQAVKGKGKAKKLL